MVDVNCINTYEVPTTNRERTMPLQPAFSATNTVLRSNVTGDGTAYTVICNNEILDQNGDYNNATGVFTVPVTGFYLFTASAALEDLAAAHTGGKLNFAINGTEGGSSFRGNLGNMRNTSNEMIISVKTIISLSATNTVQPRLQVAAGTKVVDLASSNLTYFSGALLF